MLSNSNSHTKLSYTVSLFIFFAFTAWWIYNQVALSPSDPSNALFSDTYWVLPLVGGAVGVWVAKQWGGFKSLFGKSILFFSFGLLAQVFGQVTYTYYARVQHIDAPYPSIGDIGYFGSVILYIIAISLLAKTVGASLSRVGTFKRFIAVLLPAMLLAASYIVFLRDYTFDWSHPITVLLDLGYPLGQAMYVSLAILTYFLSRGLLGGIMKNKVILLLAALLVQYSADYSFLFRFNRGTWYAGDFSDYLYLLAYILMIIALLRFKAVVDKGKADKAVE
jgi:uncharacterized membrane protein